MRILTTNFYYIFLFCLFLSFLGYSQKIVPFTNDLLLDNQRVSIGIHAHQILADTNSIYTIEQVSTVYKDKFIENQTPIQGFSKDVKTWWLRFTLKNINPTEDASFYLLTDDNDWAMTEFYSNDSSKSNPQRKWIKEQGGWAIPDAECHTDRVTESLLIELEGGEEKIIYVRKTLAYLQPTQNKGVVQEIASKNFHNVLTDEFMFIFIIEAIFLGIVAMMTLYNFALFVAIRERSYFWYVCLIASFGFSFSEEALYEIAADGGLFYYKLLDFLNAVAIIFSVLFANTFLHTKTKYPFWFWALNITLIIPMCTIIFIGFDFFSSNFRSNFLNIFFIPNSLLHLFLLLALGIRGKYRKDAEASLFLLSGGLLLFSMFTWNVHLLLFGQISTITFLGFVIYLSPKISFIVMSLLFSKHLTLRITELRKKLWQEQLQREIEKKNIFEQQNTTLEQLVQVRTSEIEQQKEEIETQRDALEEQNQKITKQHEDITASINAALRIQKAMLPLTNEISTVLPQHFILFRPRDIVSGDFYYFFSNQNLQNAFANENPAFEARNSWQQNILPITVLAAVDCTGHGVPGALMSMIGNELLNEIIQTKNISEANQILNYLDAGIRRTLQQEETENTDGMDIALCVIKKMTNQVIIEYAGANNPLYYVKTMQEGETSNNVFQEIKADKIPIGGKYKPEQLFTKHSIIIENNNQIITTFYLFSDGLQDQFGGEKGKKFMVKKLKEFFTSIAHLPLEEQKQITEHTLETWKKGYEQVDDILVIGFRV